MTFAVVRKRSSAAQLESHFSRLLQGGELAVSGTSHQNSIINYKSILIPTRILWTDNQLSAGKNTCDCDVGQIWRHWIKCVEDGNPVIFRTFGGAGRGFWDFPAATHCEVSARFNDCTDLSCGSGCLPFLALELPETRWINGQTCQNRSDFVNLKHEIREKTYCSDMW